jgi:hypothetical protein
VRFAVKLPELSREVEFQEGRGHRLWMRPPVRMVFVTSV